MPHLPPLQLIPLLLAAVGLSPGSAPGAPPPDIPALITQLGADDYDRREAATHALIEHGDAALASLRAAQAEAADPEVRFRLGFILDNLVMPDEAVMILRAAPGADLECGDLITHLNGRRVRDSAGLYARLSENDVGGMLRIRRGTRPIEVGPIKSGDLPALTEYRAPRGNRLRSALLRYRAGFAEEAAATLDELGDVPENEFPKALRGIIYYTAGQSARGMALIDPELVVPPDGRLGWTNASGLDLTGPLPAPLRIEQRILNDNHLPNMLDPANPDLEIQRILVPANQLIAAATGAARLWHERYRDEFLAQRSDGRVAGNMLAVVAWMMSDLDLVSECVQLIGPRSAILGSKWVRVRSDAWPEFLRGDVDAALERFWRESYAILSNPPDALNMRVYTRNSDVAAAIALFAYQKPEDERLDLLLELVRQPGFDALDSFLQWTYFALNVRNETRIRNDLAGLLPALRGPSAAGCAAALTRLAYVAENFDEQLFASARERLLEIADETERRAALAVADALRALRREQPREALALLRECPAAPGVELLRRTARLIERLPAADQRPRGLRHILAATPRDESTWLVLTSDRRLADYTPTTGAWQPLDAPTPDWFPGVANWPWIGGEDGGGRTWCYDRRRVIELPPAGAPAVALNIKPDEIGLFDLHVGPVFSTLAAALATAQPPGGEAGEFLQTEIQANRDYVADPALPEIGVIAPFPAAPHLLHVALRGGPQLLIDTRARKTWSSDWFAERLNWESPARFVARATWDAPAPVLWLCTTRGLIRFEPDTEKVEQIALPGVAGAPAVIPESCPYDRRGPFFYVARLPDDGGAVYRIPAAGGPAEPTDLTNIVLPPEYFRLRSRAELRAQVDAALQQIGIASLADLVRDAEETVARALGGQG